MHPGIVGLVFLQLMPNLLVGSTLPMVILLDRLKQRLVVVVEDSLHSVNPQPRPVFRWVLTDSYGYNHLKRMASPPFLLAPAPC